MDIEKFRQQFHGVRANRYEIAFASNLNVLSGELTKLYVKALSVPGSNIGMIPVSFQGRQIKFSGERQFNEWSFTCYDSNDKRIRNSLEEWIDKMDSVVEHRVNYDVSEEWTVKYNDMSTTSSGTTNARGFKLFNCWPIDISPIDLSYDMVDSFAEFTVTVAYDYHKPI